MSTAQILSGVASGVAGSLMYLGVFTLDAASTAVHLPGMAAPPGTSAALTTLFQTAPIPVSTVALTLGNASAAVAARTVVLPLSAFPTPAGAQTITAAGSCALLAGNVASTTFRLNGGASANNPGKYLLMIWQ
jgi:hypothetical protein